MQAGRYGDAASNNLAFQSVASLVMWRFDAKK